MQAMSPQEIKKHTENCIPEFVFEVVNKLLALNPNEEKDIKQKDIISGIKSHKDYKDGKYDNKWLNFEEAYRCRGWEVWYDRPHYTESYDAYFRFTPED